jgi:hypothetical protein
MANSQSVQQIYTIIAKLRLLRDINEDYKSSLNNNLNVFENSFTNSYRTGDLNHDLIHIYHNWLIMIIANNIRGIADAQGKIGSASAYKLMTSSSSSTNKVDILLETAEGIIVELLTK